MSSFRIDIKTDSDAFRSHDDTLGIEIARILRSLAARVTSTLVDTEVGEDVEFTIRDINGNTIGIARIEEDVLVDAGQEV